ncbi:MAG: hypothetical protein HXX08_11685 [Chloroflexi bacterium]|uniref:N-acetyltransferase domain-containing protein n=1 Tax=Candidatus Chlorohelix allophototropha TaxID=3003348 RepID=A0A8T7M2V4_9CHLR|nr:hypothetical protein [Chloroflexota bacterium]WJW65900.1 hypothetical protein OZ401_001680 [Chloroflexota bacterium L227-S17]
MFGFFKKKEKDEKGTNELEWGGALNKRKLSASQAAKEEEEQRQIDLNSKERRDMYCRPGVERIFNDVDGRHIALRTEDNTGQTSSEVHPPVNIAAYWGTRQIAGGKARLIDSQLHLYHYDTLPGYEERGVGLEILREAELIARNKGLKAISVSLPKNDNSEWNESFFTTNGFIKNGEGFVKSL